MAIALLILSSTAYAGPAVMPEFVCKGNVAVVEVIGHDHGIFYLRTQHPPRSCGDDQHFHPEGCMLSRAQISAKGDLRVGHVYVATLEPTGGAECSTTATATHWFRLW